MTENIPHCYNEPSERNDIYGKVSLALNGFATCSFVVAGTVGNVASICMVPKLKLGKEFLCYLVALAIWDITVLLCSFGYYGLHTVIKTFGSSAQFSPYLTQILNGPSTTAMTGSIWIVVGISVARYKSISNPINHRASASKRRTVLICCAILFMAAFFTFPYYFEIKIVPCRTKNGTIDQDIAPTKLRADSNYRLIYRSILSSLFISIVPFLTVFALSIRIIWILRQQAKQEIILREALKSMAQNQGRSRAKKNEKRISQLFAVLLGKFLCCYSLPTTLNLIEMFQGASVFSEIYFALLADISNFLVVLNSATNFLVYFWWRHHYHDPKASVINSGMTSRHTHRDSSAIMHKRSMLVRAETEQQLRKHEKTRYRRNTDFLVPPAENAMLASLLNSARSSSKNSVILESNNSVELDKL